MNIEIKKSIKPVKYDVAVKLLEERLIDINNDKKYTYTALLPDYFKKLLKTKRLRFPNS